MEIRVHAILYDTLVNGPGKRMAIWTQGCGKGCKGCFNPETWKFEGGNLWDARKLAEHVSKIGPEGITLSGGDPLEQPAALLEFLKALHDENGELRGIPRGIICFTGYTVEEVEQIPLARECLQYIDLLIDGRFVEELKHEHTLSGSSNQRFHFSSKPGRGKERIGTEEIETDQEVEIHSMNDNGFLEVTGFPAINRNELKKLGIRVIQ